MGEFRITNDPKHPIKVPWAKDELEALSPLHWKSNTTQVMFTCRCSASYPIEDLLDKQGRALIQCPMLCSFHAHIKLEEYVEG